MKTYRFVFALKQCLTIILSISLVYASIPAELMGSSCLAPPGYTKNIQLVPKKQSLFDMFRDIPGFNKLRHLYSRAFHGMNRAKKILKIAKGLQDKNYIIKEFLHVVKVTSKHELPTAYNNTDITFDIMITNRDSTETYLVKKLKSGATLKGFFSKTHQNSACVIFQKIANKKGYTGVIIAEDKARSVFLNREIRHVVDKLYIFAGNRYGDIDERILVLRENYSTASGKLKRKQTQNNKHNHNKITKKINGISKKSRIINNVGVKKITAEEVINKMNEAKDLDGLQKIYMLNLGQCDRSDRAIINKHFQIRSGEILRNKNRLFNLHSL